ncbi:MAG: PEP/pyruvate-binding domain-containing protein, partial [Anaerolineae bacterium]
LTASAREDMSHYIRWLDEVGLDDLPSAGAKAARLGEARRHGLPVPDGFCVTAAAYRAAVEATAFWAARPARFPGT